MSRSKRSGLFQYLIALFAGFPAHAVEVETSKVAGAEITTENVHLDGTKLRGLVLNHGTHRTQDVQLGITYHWLSANVLKQGEGNPDWATRVVLPGTLAPGGSREFSYVPTLPVVDHTQGSFHPAATVMGYTRFDEFAQPHSYAVGH